MSARPRRKKKSRAAHLRPFWFLLLLFAGGAAFGGYYAATWPGFYPQSIAVRGNRIVPSAAVLAAAQISPRENLWLQNSGAAARRIEAIPFVKTVRIHRGLPARVRITISERAPFAVLHTRTGSAIVDRDLRVLESAAADATLPVLQSTLEEAPPAGAFVKNASLVRLRDDYETLGAAHVIVRSLSYDRFGDLVAVMRGGVRLLLGSDDDLQRKTPLIAPILSQLASGGRRVAAVDLRAIKTPIVVYK